MKINTSLWQWRRGCSFQWSADAQGQGFCFTLLFLQQMLSFCAKTSNSPEMTRRERQSFSEDHRVRGRLQTLWKEHGSKWEVRKGEGESVRETVCIFVCIRVEKSD